MHLPNRADDAAADDYDRDDDAAPSAAGPVEAFRNDGPRPLVVRGEIGEAAVVRPGEWAVRSAGREARALSDETFQTLYCPVEE